MSPDLIVIPSCIFLCIENSITELQCEGQENATSGNGDNFVDKNKMEPMGMVILRKKQFHGILQEFDKLISLFQMTLIGKKSQRLQSSKIPINFLQTKGALAKNYFLSAKKVV
uniref:Uncharacterized protein n=1 Tax=Arundo donax TaxID=35708 RepID=A0A0A9G759_ARUDO